jgi:hypothetical protein
MGKIRTAEYRTGTQGPNIQSSDAVALYGLWKSVVYFCNAVI